MIKNCSFLNLLLVLFQFLVSSHGQTSEECPDGWGGYGIPCLDFCCARYEFCTGHHCCTIGTTGCGTTHCCPSERPVCFPRFGYGACCPEGTTELCGASEYGYDCCEAGTHCEWDMYCMPGAPSSSAISIKPSSEPISTRTTKALTGSEISPPSSTHLFSSSSNTEKKDLHYCQAWGDPHLRGFFGDYRRCDVFSDILYQTNWGLSVHYRAEQEDDWMCGCDICQCTAITQVTVVIDELQFWFYEVGGATFIDSQFSDARLEVTEEGIFVKATGEEVKVSRSYGHLNVEIWGFPGMNDACSILCTGIGVKKEINQNPEFKRDPLCEGLSFPYNESCIYDLSVTSNSSFPDSSHQMNDRARSEASPFWFPSEGNEESLTTPTASSMAISSETTLTSTATTETTNTLITIAINSTTTLTSTSTETLTTTIITSTLSEGFGDPNQRSHGDVGFFSRLNSFLVPMIALVFCSLCCTLLCITGCFFLSKRKRKESPETVALPSLESGCESSPSTITNTSRPPLTVSTSMPPSYQQIKGRIDHPPAYSSLFDS